MLLTCANLCNESYADRKPAGFYDLDDLRYGIVDIRGIPTIVVRGTANLKNWLRDVRAFPMRSRFGGYIHKGVGTGAETILKDGRIDRLPKAGPVIAIGHSLGGAIAREIARYLGNRCQLVTFGAMKSDVRFFEAPEVGHIRITNDDDPVPHLPGMLYRQDCESALNMRDADYSLIDIEDHFMTEYILRLGKVETSRLVTLQPKFA